jgi:hypothetical protein
MDGDNDDHGHSINDDYMMAGLRGDDESALEADREKLFGIEAPNPIAGHGDNPNAGADVGGDVVDDGTVITGARGAKKRKATYEAWNDFEKIFETIDGKSVRTGAKCFHCGNTMLLDLVLELAI